MTTASTTVAEFRDAHPVTGVVSQANVFKAISALEMVLLSLAWLTTFALHVAGGYDAVGWFMPVSVIAIMATFNWQMVRSQPFSLWSPIFSFRLASMVFFGFGAFLTEHLSYSAQELYKSYLPYTDQEASHVFLIWLSGVTCAMLSCFLAERLFPARATEEVQGWRTDRSTLSLGLMFAGAGLGYAYLIRLPIEMGFLPIVTIPTSISTPFDAALAVGVFLLSLWALRRGGLAILLIPLIVIPACAIGLILLTKFGTLLPLIFAGLAVLFERINVFRVLFVTVVLVSSFAVLQPMIAYARLQTSLDAPLDPASRLADMKDYLVHGSSDANESTETDFLRFGHTHVAAFIVDRFDSGAPNDELQGVFVALVPRIIWKDKPAVTQGAADLYYLVSGREGSALATTTFADLYWNAGWPGVIVVSLAWGALMWFASRKNAEIVKRRDWFMMPFVLLTFLVGMSQESSIVSGTIIPTIIAVVAYGALSMTRSLIAK